MTKHGYMRDSTIQRYIEDNSIWTNIVLLQKGGGAADLEKISFKIDGMRAYVSTFDPGSAAEYLGELVEKLRTQVQGEALGE